MGLICWLANFFVPPIAIVLVCPVYGLAQNHIYAVYIP